MFWSSTPPLLWRRALPGSISPFPTAFPSNELAIAIAVIIQVFIPPLRMFFVLDMQWFPFLSAMSPAVVRDEGA